MTTRLFARHKVEDYRKWRAVYDEFDARRAELGVQDDGVYRSVEDPNDVTVWHDFRSPQDARTFAQSDDLRGAMDRAGVSGQPSIWIADEAN